MPCDTGRMHSTRSQLLPAGIVATLVGAVIGGPVGFFVGVLVANALTADAGGGLEVLGLALTVLFLATCLCQALGVGIALALRRHERSVVTGLLAFPAAMLTIFVTVTFRGDDATTLLFLILISAVSLWLARTLALLTVRPDQTTQVREG